jgi:aerobic carbon-monoxide dehydrogenase large subunit
MGSAFLIVTRYHADIRVKSYSAHRKRLALEGVGRTGIGQPLRRREDFRLLRGGGCYSDDFKFPEQTYALMVRSPHAHARIGAIDTRLAQAVPGVLAVLTGRDMLEDGLQAIPHSVGTRHPADITLENRDGSPPFIPPHFPMTVEEARHCGEIVAMVVATSLAAAKDAAERGRSITSRCRRSPIR